MWVSAAAARGDAAGSGAAGGALAGPGGAPGAEPLDAPPLLVTRLSIRATSSSGSSWAYTR
jgi:hypothetical protein